MTKSSKLNFKANAGIKDIVGRGLIYDDNVAIIELVKNSKDAQSTKAAIHFFNETESSAESSMVIADDGIGMTIDDIKDKWLNIAYSEKKGKRLNAKTAYAGNKGVGRFSCDRLGSQLTLYTKSPKGDYLKLFIDWIWFEDKDKDDEISSIDLQCEVLSEAQFKKEIKPLYEVPFTQGTILKITHLRSQWDKKKLKTLIAELEKFSPSLNNDFDVYLYTNTHYKITDGEKKNDKSDWWKKLNGKINNNILDTLSFKTTYIHSIIDETGDNIVTTLYYQKEKIYWYTLKNPYKYLKGVEVEIHFLDTVSKGFFKRKYGVIAGDYGSIFLFHNDFRISPYGNPRNDWLGLDYWKSQGYGRRLGTRDVIGQIRIEDNEEQFVTMTNREGLVKNDAFWDLIAYEQEARVSLKNGKEGYGFIPVIVRQLENFVVKGLNWGKVIDKLYPQNDKFSLINVVNDPDRYELEPVSAEKLREACERILTPDWDVQEFDINANLVQRISKKKEEKIQQQVLKTLDIVEKKDPLDWSSVDKGAIKKTIQKQQEQKELAEQEWEYEFEKRSLAEEETKKVAEKLDVEKKRSNFLEGLASPEKTLEALITHVMKQVSGGVEKDVKATLSMYYKTPEKVTKEDLVQVLEDVAFDMSTIKESANIAEKAGFDLKVSTIKTDIFGFVEDYVSKIASQDRKWGVQLSFMNIGNSLKVLSFRPVELCMLIVNLLDNARKAGASKMNITCQDNMISFADNGSGFDFSKFSEGEYIQKGFSTTYGAGLGLYHVKKIADRLKAKLSIGNNEGKGAVINLEF